MKCSNARYAFAVRATREKGRGSDAVVVVVVVFLSLESVFLVSSCRAFRRDDVLLNARREVKTQAKFLDGSIKKKCLLYRCCRRIIADEDAQIPVCLSPNRLQDFDRLFDVEIVLSKDVTAQRKGERRSAESPSGKTTGLIETLSWSTFSSVRPIVFSASV